MKVLVTGGLGFIGAFVAEKFSNNGHKVVIIDNLSSGKMGKVGFKHRFYNLDVTSEKCEEIFKSYSFDIVVHLAYANKASLSEQQSKFQASENTRGLINILDLSSKYKIKKVIFASDCQVYRESDVLPINEQAEVMPLTQNTLSKHISEIYCNNAKNIDAMDTVVLRLSNVYGPRQGLFGSHGFVSRIIEESLKNSHFQKIESKAMDFIYVEDVAEAIYKVAFNECNGVLNLSANVAHRLEYISNTIKRLNGIRPDSLDVNIKPLISNVYYDNTNIKRQLDWVPIYSIEEGLEKTVEWYRNYNLQNEKLNEVQNDKQNKEKNVKPNEKQNDNQNKKQNKLQNDKQNANNNEKQKDSLDNKSSKNTNWKTYIPYFENIACFILIIFLNKYITQNLELKLIDLRLIYILIMGILYGTKQSSISAALSSLFFVANQLTYGSDIISIFYDVNALLQIGFYVLIGVTSGYSIDKKNNEVLEKNLQINKHEDKLSFLYDLYNETREVKDELQYQLVNHEDSFGKIYKIVSDLESLDSSKIIFNCINVVENIMKTNCVSVYLLKNDKSKYMRLFSKSQNLDIGNSIDINLCIDIIDTVSKGEVFVNYSLKTRYPAMAVPIYNGTKLYGVVFLHKTEFSRLTLHYQNTFYILSKLISSNLTRALAYEDATVQERCINGTNILNYEYFKKIFLNLDKAQAQNNASFSLIQVTPMTTIRKFSQIISENIRDIDTVGVVKDGRMFIILHNSNEIEANRVFNRLKQKGIRAKTLLRVS